MAKTTKKCPTILMFGATGFVAKHLIRKLSEFDITCIVRKLGVQKLEVKKVITYDEVESLNYDLNFDYVIDFASNVSVEKFVKQPLTTYLENIDIPKKHLKILQNLKFKGHYILISSDRALVPNSNQRYINNLKINNDPYGASKFFSELMLDYCVSILDAKFTILRLPNLYGPGQTSQQLVPTLIKRILSGEKRVEINSFDGSRNFLHVYDAVDAIKLFIERPFNVKNIEISGENIEISKLLHIIQVKFLKLKQLHCEFVERDGPRQRTKYILPPEFLDDRWFRENYDWVPRISIEEGVQTLIQDGGIYDRRKY